MKIIKLLKPDTSISNGVLFNDNVCIEIQTRHNRQFTIQQRSLINILLTIYSKVHFSISFQRWLPGVFP